MATDKGEGDGEVGSKRWAVDGGRWAVDGRQWAVDGGQWAEEVALTGQGSYKVEGEMGIAGLRECEIRD